MGFYPSGVLRTSSQGLPCSAQAAATHDAVRAGPGAMLERRSTLTTGGPQCGAPKLITYSLHWSKGKCIGNPYI